MTQVAIGTHAKIVARHADQQRIRAFYRDVLGCVLTKESRDVDYIRFAGGFFLAVLYRDAAPEPDELERAIWLELCAEDPAEVRQKIVAFGVREIAMPADVEHIYFHAPGGPVFRLVGARDDLSRFEG